MVVLSVAGEMFIVSRECGPCVSEQERTGNPGLPYKMFTGRTRCLCKCFLVGTRVTRAAWYARRTVLQTIKPSPFVYAFSR